MRGLLSGSWAGKAPPFKGGAGLEGCLRRLARVQSGVLLDVRALDWLRGLQALGRTHFMRGMVGREGGRRPPRPLPTAWVGVEH